MKNKYLDFYKINFGVGKYCVKSWGLASYEAGAASRQDEIDLLEKEIIETQEFLNNQNCIKQAEIDELQNDLIKAAEGQMKLFEHNNELHKRINLALSAVWNDKCSHTIIDILKGESNE